MITSFKRIIKIGWKSFFRNIALNMTAVFVVTMAVFLITMLFIFNSFSNILVSSVQEKVDISVYFKESVLIEEALRLKSIVAKIPEVRDIKYVSKEQALEDFIVRHKDDPVLMESLAEIGQNPFLASLNIKAWQASQYGQVTKFLEGDSFKGLIEEIDYYKREPVIERIFSITSGINRGVVFFGMTLGLIAFLIAFNTIKIAIKSSSEEISIMKLVGASNWFIRGPFLVQGAIVGVLAVLIALSFVFITTFGLDSKIQVLTPEISIFGLLVNNFFVILSIQLITGIGLGTVSSALAIRKYLKV